MNLYTYPNILTKYYFDTFIVGSHHSIPHLIADLLNRKQYAEEQNENSKSELEKIINNKLISFIDDKLSDLDITQLDDLESSEKIYWINQLGRQSALEISTYGRLRPDTMDLLMCLPEEDFIITMSIAGKLSNRIQILGETSLSSNTDLPPSMPVIS